jgi:hypothetical protein
MATISDSLVELADGATESVSDAALLHRYVELGCGEAFAGIVYRHGGWVYHLCRRNLGDAHLAEDAAQAVFLLLSRKAGCARRFLSNSLPPGIRFPATSGGLDQALGELRRGCAGAFRSADDAGLRGRVGPAPAARRLPAIPLKGDRNAFRTR